MQKRAKQVTQSTYRGEHYYDQYPEKDWRRAFYQEVLFRDKKTAGFVMNYPHGTIITQSERSFYYRGENQIYSNSIPTLNRKLNQLATDEERVIYRMISDMRIAEFATFLFQFMHVQKWQERYGTVLVDALAQHYGLETYLLDITNDFNIALFFTIVHMILRHVLGDH